MTDRVAEKCIEFMGRAIAADGAQDAGRIQVTVGNAELVAIDRAVKTRLSPHVVACMEEVADRIKTGAAALKAGTSLKPNSDGPQHFADELYHVGEMVNRLARVAAATLSHPYIFSAYVYPAEVDRFRRHAFKIAETGGFSPTMPLDPDKVVHEVLRREPLSPAGARVLGRAIRDAVRSAQTLTAWRAYPVSSATAQTKRRSRRKGFACRK